MTPLNPMTELDEIIAEAAQLPLPDAAYLLWRRKSKLDKLDAPITADEITEAGPASIPEIPARIRSERDEAQDGPTFDRLKRAHPQAGDADLKQAIITAVKFDSDCFRNFRRDRGDFWERVVRSVARAARRQPGYLETTYHDARNHVAYHEK